MSNLLKKERVNMDFFGIEFLKKQSGLIDYVWYIFIFMLLIILLVILGLSLRDRLKTKYRELSLIIFLLLLFSLGIQYSNYKIYRSKDSQSSQMVSFLTSLSHSKKININNIYVNTTQFTDGIIVKIDSHYYKVSINADQKTYILTETFLINNHVNIIKK